MANNPILFNAVIAGVVGGVNTSRSLTSPVAANYAGVVTNAVAFATLLDAEIPVGVFGQADADLLASIVQEVISGKGSAGLNMTNILAIIAAFTQARASLDPAGGGGLNNRLTNVFFVDSATTVPTASQNGAIGTPFATVQQAVTALEPDGGCVYIAPGLYDEVVTITEPTDLIGMVSEGVAEGAFPRVTITEIAGASSVVGLYGIDISDDLVTAGLRAQHCFIEADIVLTGTCEVTDCIFTGAITPGADVVCNFKNCSVSSFVADNSGGFDQAFFDNCALGVVQNSSILNIRLCSLGGNITGVGDMNIDTNSYYDGIRQGRTITQTGIRTFTDKQLSITLSIVVPAVAADAVGYVDTSLVGTALEGVFAVNDPVIVNPQSDLVAAGAGGGYINSRISAANTLRSAFNGALAGGAANFTVCRGR